jgi:adenylate kinase family enzyme
MSRVVIIGNAGGGKSTLARILSDQRALHHVEIDRLLWQEGWQLTPIEVYEREHAEIIKGDSWVIDGLGQKASISSRISRATDIILIDMPLWMHFWLAAERQIAWALGKVEHTPGGISEMPPTRGLFQAIWEVDRDWMPQVRALCIDADKDGKSVTRITSVNELDALTRSLRNASAQ